MLTLLPFFVTAALATAPPSREVLLLYGAESRNSLRGESSYTACETVLNHLGLTARYWDVSRGLPDARGARGIVSLIEGPAVEDPAALDAWLTAQAEAGTPICLLGGAAVLQEGTTGRLAPEAAWRGVLARLGVEEGAAVASPATTLPGPHTGFEAGYDEPLPAAPLHNRDAGNAVFLRLRHATGEVDDAGIVGKRGAIATSVSCLLETNPLTYRLRWRVDPFWLFARALKSPGEPALDATTLSGRRLFYAHVDGDGFANRAVRRGTPLAAEVLRDEVLKRTSLPTTVSVIARDLVGHPEREAIARTIFALPHVEAASHTYTHPHDFERGVGTPEGAVTDAASDLTALPKMAFNPAHEVDDSIRYVQKLLPKGKTVTALFWPGMTNPTAPFLARTEALGLANLNGGDATLAPVGPSYANLSPLARWVGPYLQVYASSANENLFTNLWTGPYDGQRRALDLYRFSGSPRRMAPVNIYYHFYAAERLAGLRALQTLYRWAESQPLCAITASEYCAVVEGFYGAAVVPDGPNAWRVAHAGACRTLRFDQEPREVDLAASEAVAGYCRANGSLYIHLAAPDARVVLAEQPPAMPRLESASAPLAAWSRPGHGLEATFKGHAPITVTLAGFTPGEPVRLRGDFSGSATPDAEGRLFLAAPAGERRLEVSW